MDNLTTDDARPVAAAPTSMPPPPIPLGAATAAGVLPFSSARPFWYVALLTVATFGMYQVVWFYRAWTAILQRYNLKGNALVNALFITFCSRSFFRYAYALGAEVGFTPWMSPTAAFTLYLSFVVISGVFSRLGNTDHGLGVTTLLSLVFTFLVLIPLRDGVEAMNAGYSVVEPGRPMRDRLSGGAIACLILGCITWAFVVIGFCTPSTTP